MDFFLSVNSIHTPSRPKEKENQLAILLEGFKSLAALEIIVVL